MTVAAEEVAAAWARATVVAEERVVAVAKAAARAVVEAAKVASVEMVVAAEYAAAWVVESPSLGKANRSRRHNRVPAGGTLRNSAPVCDSSHLPHPCSNVSRSSCYIARSTRRRCALRPPGCFAEGLAFAW